MTQKELLYVEDAIKHEENIISICEDMTNTLEDTDLVTFIDEEIKKHEKFQKELINFLEGKSNE